ncbi:hypothetical protein DU87_07435 [Methanosarcina mazei]|uniref:Uncharacterized protein n=1 Tax=Methanosarcina mazei TaxID=2209 RepID=A0A0F8QKB5_METMZ|nr:hypothetical protein DU40_15770 [Methanosarcina mazei]KKH66005.1 hypothetical protein DU87_07435 [Methanosarcina mazei]
MCGKVNNDKNHNYKIWQSAHIVEGLSIVKKGSRFTCFPVRNVPVLICIKEIMVSSEKMKVIKFLKQIKK